MGSASCSILYVDVVVFIGVGEVEVPAKSLHSRVCVSSRFDTKTPRKEVRISAGSQRKLVAFVCRAGRLLVTVWVYESDFVFVGAFVVPCCSCFDVLGSLVVEVLVAVWAYEYVLVWLGVSV